MAALPMLAEGTVLGGRYRIVRELGRGGMGVVYEAVQQDLNRRVALKVLFAFAAGPQLERFRREAQSAAELRHPNIVQVTDFQAPGDGPPFLVMELLEGVSLGDVIERQGPIPYPRVAFIATQILAAVSAAHRAGVVHRDIKPDNVFLTTTSVAHDLVKLLDFGVAKVESDAAPMTSYGQVIGTPAYMPPEQARGGAVDARSDLFAVGATMYHAITGRLPAPPPDGLSPTVQAPLSRSVMSTAALSLVRPDLPTALTALVDRAMSLDPAERFASADEMRAAVAAWSPPSSSPEMGSLPPAGPQSFVNAPTVAPYTIGAPTLQPAPAQHTMAAPTLSNAPPPPSISQAPQAAPAPQKSGTSGLLIAALVIAPVLMIAVAGIFFMLGRATPQATKEKAAGLAAASAPAPAAAAPSASAAEAASSPAFRAQRPLTATAPHAVPSATASSTPSKGARVSFGGVAGGHWSNSRTVSAVVEQRGDLPTCFAKFDPQPKQSSRDYNFVIDGSAKVVDVQAVNGGGDAVDRCAIPILKTVRFPTFAVALKTPTFTMQSRVTWTALD